MTTAITPAPDIPIPQAHASLLRRLVKRPLGAISLAFLVLVGLVAIVGPMLAPYNPNTASLQLVLAPPSPEHLLGGDSAGRDVFSRLLAATQVSIAAALLALVVALVIGVIAGLIAGYYRGWFDNVSAWLTTLVMSLPGLVVLLAARAVLGPSVWISMIIFGVILSPAFYRLTYVAVTAVRNELYVDAARVSGLSDGRIISRHILYVVRAPIIIQAAIIMSIAIAIQAGLDFLGLGDTSLPTWGGMLNDGFANIYKAPLLMVWPSLAIALTSISLVLLANAMRDVLERTVVVRRKRRRAVATATGSVAANGLAAAGPITHLDDDRAAARTGEVVLSVIDLHVGYQTDKGSTEVVHGVSLDIRRGEVHGLIGESGSGKTQTAFAVLGLLPRGGRITAGTVEYEGVRLDQAPERELTSIRGRRIGYIPQEPMSNLDPSFTIGSQLVEPLRVGLGLSRKEATEKSLALLDRVGIPDPKRTFSAYPHEISGGMAQRVLIAGAVSTDPDLIIADEPTTALDVTVQAEVLDVLRSLQDERHMAMLLVTHNFGVVADLCDRVSVMQAGLIVETGPVRSIFHHAEHPYTESLLAAILDEGPARPPLGLSTTGALR
jgi:peptide/nickel transport system permease protein